MDKRKFNKGTKGNKGGRKSKSEEQSLCEKLSPLEENVFKQLELSINNGDSWAIKMYFEYMYGKPTEKKEVVLNEMQPLFPDTITEEEFKIMNKVLEEKY
tara:strand:- start:123 stop:422 length:300 start_codon:yes stop_codon:yes gene_type:complete